jgi:dTDP-4-amino-4,6-dideoxygalactose transaminase
VIVDRLSTFYLGQLNEIIKKRQKIARKLKKNLKDTGLVFQSDYKDEHIYTYFSFLLPNEIASKRMKLLKILKENGVVGRVIWDHPFGISASRQFPNTKKIAERIMGIPVNPDYTEREIADLSKRIILSLNQLK